MWSTLSLGRWTSWTEDKVSGSLILQLTRRGHFDIGSNPYLNIINTAVFFLLH